jgi:hypothetical protein
MSKTVEELEAEVVALKRGLELMMKFAILNHTRYDIGIPKEERPRNIRAKMHQYYDEVISGAKTSCSISYGMMRDLINGNPDTKYIERFAKIIEGSPDE